MAVGSEGIVEVEVEVEVEVAKENNTTQRFAAISIFSSQTFCLFSPLSPSSSLPLVPLFTSGSII